MLWSVAVGVFLSLAGYAWQAHLHDRFPWAPYSAAFVLLSGVWVSATLSLPVHLPLLLGALGLLSGGAWRTLYGRSDAGRNPRDAAVGLLLGVILLGFVLGAPLAVLAPVGAAALIARLALVEPARALAGR